ncbi:MAG TPA: hypothetical protein VEX69_07515 [Candidatus Limnocylindria bacterium]|nr:hypothetical protein [Candidatus Limnocylindria bacterium]
MQIQAASGLSMQMIPPVLAFVAAVGVFFVGKYLDARSVNHAVLAEMKRIIEVVKKHQEWWTDKMKAKDTNFPLIPFSHAVYTTQVQNIGVLSGRLVVRAVQFYGYLDFLNALQASRPQFIAAGKPAEFDEMYGAVLGSFVRTYGRTFEKEFSKLR